MCFQISMKLPMIVPMNNGEEEEQEIIRSQENIQREGLEMIIYLYLNKKNDEQLSFLNANFGEIEDLAESLKTNLNEGLSEKRTMLNQEIYGHNSKKNPVHHYSFREICWSLIVTWNFIICSISFILSFIYSLASENGAFLKDSLSYYMCYVTYTFIRIGISYYYEEQLSMFALERDKNNWYRVMRSNQIIEVQEHELIVGDILVIGYKQKVPASGIFIGDEQIIMNEEHVGKKFQKKQSFKNCFRTIGIMCNQVDKSCYSKNKIPSPIIIRGSELLQGDNFKMMILTVTEDELIKKHTLKEKNGLSCPQYEKWNNNFIYKWEITIFIIFIVSSMILTLGKIIADGLLRPKTQINYLKIFEIIRYAGFLSCLTDIGSLSTFLRIRMIKFIKTLETPQKITEYLTADRMLISQQNIIKYDRISIQKFGFLESEDIVDDSTINNIDQMTLGITQQILQRIDIECCIDSIHRNNTQATFDGIVQRYQPDEKIVSCLSLTKLKYPRADPKRNKSIDKKGISEIKRQEISKMRKRGSGFLQPVKKKMNLSSLGSNNTLLNQGVVLPKTILQSITELAEKQCRTYYFVKYSEKALSEVNKILQTGLILPFISGRQEQVKSLAKKLKYQHHVSPFLLGYRHGFQNRQPMDVLVSVVGVSNSKANNLIIQQFKKVESVGITALIIKKKVEDSRVDEDKILEEYEQRQLIQKQTQRILNMEVVRERSGRLVCNECLIKNCNCLNKQEELSDIQSFLYLNEYARIIYNVDFSYDIRYLECAFTQICNTSLNLYSNKCKTQKILESIIESIKFSEILKRLVIYWLGMMIQNVFYCLVMWIFFCQSMYISQISFIFFINFAGGLISTLSQFKLDIQNLGKLEREKIKIINKNQTLQLIVQISVTLIICIVMAKMPFIIPQFPDQFDPIIQQYGLSAECKYSKTGMMGNLFNPSLCSYDSQVVYSRLSTMIGTYIFFVNWLTLLLKHRNFKSVPSIIIYLGMISLYLLFLYSAPTLIDSYKWGLNILQLLICILLAGLTFVMSLGLGHLISLFPCIHYFESELSSTIVFNEEYANHYSKGLKEYLKYINSKIKSQ